MKVINLNKKGQDFKTIVGIVILLIVLFWFTTSLASQKKVLGGLIDPQLLKNKETACRLNTQTAVDQGLVLTKENDIDSDELIDSCDTCVCYSSSCRNIRENEDFQTKMILGCINYDSKGKIAGCRFTSTDDGRCVEGAPKPTR